ncbi:hypothetical protein ACFLQY_01760 [Verrucomicrobiota bacterium]
MANLSYPEKVLRSDFADEAEFVEACYLFFWDDFINSSPLFRGARMGLKRIPLRHGKEATFYHMTTEGDDEGNRTLEIDRSERIRWARPQIENETHQDLRVWSERKKGENRIHIWHYIEDYVVVIAERKGFCIPWTAFCVKYDNYRVKLERRWKRYR